MRENIADKINSLYFKKEYEVKEDNYIFNVKDTLYSINIDYMQDQHGKNEIDNSWRTE